MTAPAPGTSEQGHGPRLRPSTRPFEIGPLEPGQIRLSVEHAEHLYDRAIDDIVAAFEDGGMSETVTITPTPRRSGRVFHKVRVQAQGRAHDRRKFKETCETVVVNAHGGLLLLKHEVNNGEMLVLTNPETQEEQECRVVYLGEPGDKGQRVGIEFLTPAPRFWGVEFSDGAGTNGESAVH